MSTKTSPRRAARKVARQFCRAEMHSCQSAVTPAFAGGRQLHWCVDHTADADRYRETSTNWSAR